jgi:hypothetical protein
LSFDLPRAFARDRKYIADLLQRVVPLHLDAEAMAHRALLPGRQNFEVPARGRQRQVSQSLVPRPFHALVFDIVLQPFLLGRRDRRMQRQRRLRQSKDRLDDPDRQICALR